MFGVVEYDCSLARVIIVSAVSAFAVLDVSSFDCAKMLDDVLRSCCVWCSCKM